MYIPKIVNVEKARQIIRGVSVLTPLTESQRYSRLFGASIFFKREDVQSVRSYKIRGAFNKISSLTDAQKNKGVVCASAGNHAQGVAFSCHALKIHGTIYMPVTTPRQKVEQVAMFGQKYASVVLEGDTYDDAYNLALAACKAQGKEFIHPFDDEKIIEGQATVALEIFEQSDVLPDYVIVPVGGGGLAAGVSAVFANMAPSVKVIGVEPEGAPSMSVSMKKGKNTKLETIDKFVDGAAVQRVGDKTYAICKKYLHAIRTVPEGEICQVILDLYNKDAIVVEPAGALSIAALTGLQNKIKGKRVVCIVSGSNNDITRTAEIKERALLHAKLKHYFIVRFPQRSGALKEFVSEVLGPTDDITYFEYHKKSSKENGPAVVGIELKDRAHLQPLIRRMKARNFFGDYLNDKPDLFAFLV